MDRAFWCERNTGIPTLNYFAAITKKHVNSESQNLSFTELDVLFSFVYEMDVSTAESSNLNEKTAFQKCGRTGRRGACIDTEIATDKLKDIIDKTENVSLDNTEESAAKGNKTNA